jgi:molybdenum cofactor cytidylyltransferase
MSAVAIVPAAGKGERFGGAKLVARIGPDTILGRTLQSLFEAAVHSVIVVTAPRSDLSAVAELNDPRVRRIENPNPSRGMFSSIQCGLEAAQGDPVIVLPADMPFVRAATVAAVTAECFRSRHIVMPSFEGKRGHPVAFPSSVKPAILSAESESTLKLALASTGVAYAEVAVDDKGVLRDVDVPSDL